MKSEARKENALSNKAYRGTGNETDQQHEVDKDYQRISKIGGDKHEHGLALISELGSPFRRGY